MKLKYIVSLKSNKVKVYILELFRKSVVSNFFYLSLLQVANYILPFLIIPHLVQVVSFEKIGVIYMAQALMAYLIIFTDYGFNLTATKFISINRTSNAKLNYIFNAVISTKIFLIGLAFIILLLLVTLVPIFTNEKKLFLLSFAMVIGNTFFPVWFFQGMEEMKYISIINFVSRLLFTISIFVLVKQKSDYIKVNFLMGAGNAISCAIAFYILHKKFRMKSKFRLRYIKMQLNEGWHIFVSNLAVSLYMYSNLFLLGIFADKTTLSFFGIADKCIQGMRQLLVVFFQAIYPKACHYANISHQSLVAFYKKIFLWFLLFIVCSCLIIFSFAPFIVFILTKSYQSEVIILLRSMCLIPVIVALNIPCNQSIIIYQIKKPYTIILVAGTIINIVFNTMLAQKFQAYGTVSAIYITESFITISLYVLLLRVYKGAYSLQSLFRIPLQKKAQQLNIE